MRKITDYQIVSTYWLNKLQEDVVGQILKGWEPFGGILITNNRETESRSRTPDIYNQVMVKYDDNK